MMGCHMHPTVTHAGCLLFRYSNWCEEGETKEVVAERAAALKPSAYANFVARRAKEQQEDEDEEDEEDFDEVRV